MTSLLSWHASPEKKMQEESIRIILTSLFDKFYNFDRAGYRVFKFLMVQSKSASFQSWIVNGNS